MCKTSEKDLVASKVASSELDLESLSTRFVNHWVDRGEESGDLVGRFGSRSLVLVLLQLSLLQHKGCCHELCGRE